MALRRLLVDLVLATLADSTASTDALVVVGPDGTLKRQKAPSPMKLIYGQGTVSLVVPAGVTAIQVEAQAAGGAGGGGGSTTPSLPGGNGGDGGNTEIRRGVTAVVQANGGKGGRGGLSVSAPVTAGLGGSSGLGGISYRGQDAGSIAGANGGVTTVDALRGLGGAFSQAGSSGGGGGGGQGANALGNGGGGGEYLVAGLAVIPGETLTLVVGAGGIAGTASGAVNTSGKTGGGGFLVLTW